MKTTCGAGFWAVLAAGAFAAADELEFSAEVDRETGEVEVRAEGDGGNVFRIEKVAGGEDGTWEEVVTTRDEDGVVTYREALDESGRGMFRAASGPGSSSVQEPYHGWEGGVRLTNGIVEVEVVPEIARIMQFQFVGDEDGPFWEKRSLDGRAARPGTWNNFGGDKVWPSPQADFALFSGGTWPPPGGFDATAATTTAGSEKGVFILDWPEVEAYGLTVRREIRLLPLDPVMEVKTTYTRTSELERNRHNRPLAVWVVTQVDDVEGMYLPVAAESIWGETGYRLMGSQVAAANLTTEGGLIRIKRHGSTSFKIGSDSGSILAVYPDAMLLMDSPRVEGADYLRSEQFSTSQVYSNGSSSEPYLEMEFQSPSAVLALGESVELVVRYTLMERGEGTAEEAAERVLLGR